MSIKNILDSVEDVLSELNQFDDELFHNVQDLTQQLFEELSDIVDETE